MTDGDVSVYVIGRNCRSTLAEALGSVCAQSAPAAQIVYLDDDSTDDSVRIAERFAARGVQILRNDSRMGVPLSRNRAARACSAPWIAVLDADDSWEVGKLERQLAFLSARPEVGLIGTFARLIDAGGTDYGVVAEPETDLEIKRLELFRNCFIHSSILLRRRDFDRVGGYGDHATSEDYDLVLKLSEITAVANLSEPLVHYRIGSIASRSVRLRTQRLACAAEIRRSALRRRGIDGEAVKVMPGRLRRGLLWIVTADPHIRWGVRQMVLGTPAQGRALLSVAAPAAWWLRLLRRLLLLIPNGAYRVLRIGVWGP